MREHGDTTSRIGQVNDWMTLIRIFTSPEDDASRTSLVTTMRQLLFDLHDFLLRNVGITEEISLKKLVDDYNDTLINWDPEKKIDGVISEIFTKLAPHAVNVASPYFIGHMTAAIPYFMVHLKAVVAALNQNVVKLETSKVVSVVEKQVVAKIHRVIYNYSDDFYNLHVQNTETCLGSFTEGGTTANLTALWVARNIALGPDVDFEGIEKEGLLAAYKAYDIDRCVVLVSRRAHYSFRKAGGVLGIGNQNIISVDVDGKNRMDIDKLKSTIASLKLDGKTKIMAVVGIAGTTETGNIDPLKEIGEICRKENIHFHADAAWGGPTLMSKKYGALLSGIEYADSVTIDGHKQFYMPMSSGMIFFRDPASLDAISYHANYVNRKGSVDLGIKTLSGSREANCLILDSALKIMGRKGYGMLIDHGIELAKCFAEEINKRENFQLITTPELNILTYRICPEYICHELSTATDERVIEINQELNELNRTVQQVQRESGKSFVSRTVLELETIMPEFPDEKIVVLRSVLMNPLTNIDILKDILDEQEELFSAWKRCEIGTEKIRKSALR